MLLFLIAITNRLDFCYASYCSARLMAKVVQILQSVYKYCKASLGEGLNETKKLLTRESLWTDIVYVCCANVSFNN